MDNASALPTCPQRQQQQKTAARNLAENYPHDFTMRLFNDGPPSREVVADCFANDRRHRRTGACADISEQDDPNYRALSARRQHRSDRARDRKEPAGQRWTECRRGKQTGRECRHRHRSPAAERPGWPHACHPLGQPGHDQRPSGAAQLRSAHRPGADFQGGEQPNHPGRQCQGGHRIDCRSCRGREDQALELCRCSSRFGVASCG